MTRTRQARRNARRTREIVTELSTLAIFVAATIAGIVTAALAGGAL